MQTVADEDVVADADAVGDSDLDLTMDARTSSMMMANLSSKQTSSSKRSQAPIVRSNLHLNHSYSWLRKVQCFFYRRL